MNFFRQSFVLFTFLIFTLVQMSLQMGVFHLKLLSFENNGGRLADGTCCSDGQQRDRCYEPCKTFFRVCVKQFENRINLNSSCTFGELITPVLGNNSMDLTRPEVQAAGFTNPFQVPFNFSWPGTFTLIVEAWHENYFSNGQQPLQAKRLISRLAVQRYLHVQSTPNEKFYRSNHTTLSYSYQVVCAPNYFGDQCNRLCKPRNDTFGHYTCSASGEVQCLPGWQGRFCAEPICASGCHSEHGTCDRPGECRCKFGWTGSTCSQCERYPGCVHGSCSKPMECRCKPGWGGLLCNQNLNYCSTHSPCKNGGVCENSGPGAYQCKCMDGFIGKNCETELSLCERNPCKNDGICKTIGNSSYSCVCPFGFHGKHCEIPVGTCAKNPCTNNSTCVDGSSGPVCVCPHGYHGAHCEQRQTDCNPNPCVNGGHCAANKTSNSYTCTCPLGFSGPHCEQNIDECADQPCLNKGQCVDGIGRFTCRCRPGFIGDRCEINVDECKILPCANGGRCVDLVNGFRCDCAPGFTGAYCLTDINECDPNPCANDAQCVDKVNEFECLCPSGFTGNLCDQRLNNTSAVYRSVSSKILSSNRNNPSSSSSSSSSSSAASSSSSSLLSASYTARNSFIARPLQHRSTNDSESNTDADAERIWLVVGVACLVPLAALAVFLILRYRALKHEQSIYSSSNKRINTTNGLPCKSIDEIDAIRQNEVNNTLLNNSSSDNATKSNNNNCNKLSSSANIIVNSLHRAGSSYNVNKPGRLSAAVNQVGLPACSQKMKNICTSGTLPLPGTISTVSNQPIYGGSVAYGSVGYGHIRPHPMYSSMRPQSMYGSTSGVQSTNAFNQTTNEKRAALAAAAADYAASLYGINKSAKY